MSESATRTSNLEYRRTRSRSSLCRYTTTTKKEKHMRTCVEQNIRMFDVLQPRKASLLGKGVRSTPPSRNAPTEVRCSRWRFHSSQPIFHLILFVALPSRRPRLHPAMPMKKMDNSGRWRPTFPSPPPLSANPNQNPPPSQKRA